MKDMFLALLLAAAVIFQSQPGFSQTGNKPIPAEAASEGVHAAKPLASIYMQPGQVRILTFPAKISNVFSGAGHIADVTVLSDQKLIITAKGPGQAEVVAASLDQEHEYTTYRIIVNSPLVSADVFVHHGVSLARMYMCRGGGLCREDSFGAVENRPTGVQSGASNGASSASGTGK